MKFTDDYEAKLKIWAANPKPQLSQPEPKLPKIASRRFSSYEEFNRWKEELILQIARGNE